MSEVLAYHLGENELVINAEIELEIREAPLRERRYDCGCAGNCGAGQELAS